MAFSNTALASTLQRRQSGYLNAISVHIPSFDFLRKKGQYKAFRGGVQGLEWDVEYGLDSSEPSYAGYDTLPVTPSDNVEVASATMKNYFKSIAIAGDERRLNEGERIFNLLEQKEKNALESMQQQMNDHFYLDGTGNGGKQITGWAAIISTTPTSGTLFGLDRSTRTYWQNKEKDTNTFAFNTTTKVPTMVHDMEDLWIQCGRLKAGGAQNRWPDMILCTEAYYRHYDQVLRLIGQRFVDTNVGDPSFGTLKFHGVTLTHDSDMPADAGGDAQAYFINSRFVELHYHPQANFAMTDLTMHDEQDAFSSKLIWMGELTCSLPPKLGLHEGVQAPGA